MVEETIKIVDTSTCQKASVDNVLAAGCGEESEEENPAKRVRVSNAAYGMRNVEHATSDVRHSISNIQHGASVRYPISNMEPPSNTGYPITKIQYPVLDIRYPLAQARLTSNIRYPTSSNIEQGTSSIQ